MPWPPGSRKPMALVQGPDMARCPLTPGTDRTPHFPSMVIPLGLWERCSFQCSPHPTLCSVFHAPPYEPVTPRAWASGGSCPFSGAGSEAIWGGDTLGDPPTPASALPASPRASRGKPRAGSSTQTVLPLLRTSHTPEEEQTFPHPQHPHIHPARYGWILDWGTPPSPPPSPWRAHRETQKRHWRKPRGHFCGHFLWFHTVRLVNLSETLSEGHFLWAGLSNPGAPGKALIPPKTAHEADSHQAAAPSRPGCDGRLRKDRTPWSVPGCAGRQNSKVIF